MSKLLTAAKAGCPNSINELLRVATPTIRMIIAVHCRNKNAWIGVEDLVQDVLLEVYKSLPRIKATTLKQFNGWIRIVSLNKVYAHAVYLSASKRATATCSSTEEITDSDSMSPVEIAICNEQEAAYESILERINPYAWQVLSLSLDGVHSRDIATRVGKSVAQVYHLTRVAKRHLEPSCLLNIAR